MTSYKAMQKQSVEQEIAERRERRKKVLQGVWKRRALVRARMQRKAGLKDPGR